MFVHADNASTHLRGIQGEDGVIELLPRYHFTRHKVRAGDEGQDRRGLQRSPDEEVERNLTSLLALLVLQAMPRGTFLAYRRLLASTSALEVAADRRKRHSQRADEVIRVQEIPVLATFVRSCACACVCVSE
jgi:hypothetical protein